MTILLVLFWVAVILAIIAAVMMHRKTWSADVMWWSVIVAVILLGVQTNLITFLKPVLSK